MNAACEDRVGDLAAYAVGALGPAGGDAVEDHVAGCAGCELELEELIAVAGVVAGRRDRGHPAGLRPAPAGPVATDDLMLARLIREARTGRRRRRVAVAVAAAAAAALIVVGVVAGAGGGRPGGMHRTATDPATGVTATVAVRAVATGADLDVSIAGVPDGVHCVLVAVPRHGRGEVAGTWRASYTGTAEVQGTTALGPSQLAALLVETSTGRLLVRVPV